MAARRDAEGNLLAEYIYDAENRPIELSSGERFEYDYSGRRVKKTEGNRTSYYFNQYYEEEEIAAPGEPVAFLLWTCTGDCGDSAGGTPAIPLLGGAGVGAAADDADTVTASKYYYLNGQRVAKSVNGEFTWIHSDHLHSATILTDDSGSEIRRLAYRAFGEELENAGSGTEPKYSYTGKERDASGLMYYGARYYDPALSRFITPDTLYDRGPQGLNRYAYALNNPIRYNDPTGHSVGADPNTGLIDPPTHKDEQYYYETQPRRAHTLKNLKAGMGDEAMSLGQLAEENPEAMRALNVALGGKAKNGYTDTTVQLLTDARTATETDGDMTTITSADVAMVMARDKERQVHWFGNEGGIVTASENDIDVGIYGGLVAVGGVIRATQPSRTKTEVEYENSCKGDACIERIERHGSPPKFKRHAHGRVGNQPKKGQKWAINDDGTAHDGNYTRIPKKDAAELNGRWNFNVPKDRYPTSSE